MKSLPFLFLLVLLCSRCVQVETFIPDPDFSATYVVSANIDPATGVVVHLSDIRNQSTFIPVEDTWVIGADVTVTNLETGTTQTVPYETKGTYRLLDEDFVQASNCYRLQVMVDTRETAQSDTVCIPLLPRVSDFRSDILFDSTSGQQIACVSFTIWDDPEESFFHLKVNPERPSGVFLNLFSFSDLQLEVCEYYDVHDPLGIAFSDRCFTDASTTNRLEIATFRSGAQPLPASLRIRRTDDHFFRHFESALLPDDTRGWIIEPRPSFSNMRGVPGVFTASSSVFFRFSIP